MLEKSVAHHVVETLLAENRREQKEIGSNLKDPAFQSALSPEELAGERKKLERLRREEALLCAAKKSSAWNVIFLLQDLNVKLSASENTTLTIIGLLE